MRSDLEAAVAATSSPHDAPHRRGSAALETIATETNEGDDTLHSSSADDDDDDEQQRPTANSAAAQADLVARDYDGDDDDAAPSPTAAEEKAAAGAKGQDGRAQDRAMDKEQQEHQRQSSVSPPPAAPGPPPDGGLVAWLQVLGAFFLFMNSWGIVNTFGAYQTAYEEEGLSGKTSSDIAWVGSLQASLLLFCSFISGPLFDVGYFVHLHVGGAFLLVFGLFMTSLCKEYWQVMLAQGVCVGFGCGCLFVPSVALVATYFEKHRGFAMGIVAAGSSLGGVIYPIVFYRLRTQPSLGIPWATRALAFIALGLFGVSLPIMRTRLPARPARRLLQPSAFREPPYALFTLAATLGFTALYQPFFFVINYGTAVARASPNSLAPYLLAVLNAASVFGRLLGGHVADGYGPLNALIPSTAAACVLGFAWLGIKSPAGLIVFCVLYGFFSGTFVSLPPAVVARLSPDMSQVGTRLGQVFLFLGVGVLVGTPIGGALIRDGGADFSGVQLFTGAVLAASLVVMLATRVAYSGFHVWVKA